MTNNQNDKDDKLLALLKKESTDAFTEIYNRYGKLLAKFAANKLYDLNEAEDIVQDIFISLWKNRESINVNIDLKAYLYTTARNKITDLFRKKITRNQYENKLQELNLDYEISVEQQYYGKELQNLIDRNLNKLPLRAKQVYELSRKANYSIPEIAIKLKFSEQTIKNQLTIALKFLREKLLILTLLLLSNYIK